MSTSFSTSCAHAYGPTSGWASTTGRTFCYSLVALPQRGFAMKRIGVRNPWTLSILRLLNSFGIRRVVSTGRDSLMRRWRSVVS